MRATLTALVALSVVACTARYPLPCTYVANEEAAELEPHANCATHQGSGLTVSEDDVHRMAFDADGLAAVWVEGQWFYVKRSGAMLPVVTYDNGADDFSEGLVRSVRGGKIAYYDAAFAEVIPPKYDWGWPFENGRALVCLGCAKGEPDGDGHVAIVGGEWGYIDTHGREVVPVHLSRSAIMAK